MNLYVFGNTFQILPIPASQLNLPIHCTMCCSYLFAVSSSKCDDWEDIEDFGKAKLNWLKGLGLFREGLQLSGQPALGFRYSHERGRLPDIQRD